MDRRRAHRAGQRRDHYAGGQQDGLVGQAAGVHGGGGAQGQGVERDVHRDERQGRIQC